MRETHLPRRTPAIPSLTTNTSCCPGAAPPATMVDQPLTLVARFRPPEVRGKELDDPILLDRVARLSLTAALKEDFRRSTQYPCDVILEDPPTSLNFDAATKTPRACGSGSTPRRAASRHHHKRASSYLATPVQMHSDLYLPTPLIANGDHGPSCKRRRNNREERLRVPMLPDSPVLTNARIPVMHRPCFSPFMRSSTILDEHLTHMVRQDFSSDGTNNEANPAVMLIKDAANIQSLECPSLTPSRSSSPFQEELPYLDQTFPSCIQSQGGRLLKMRTSLPRDFPMFTSSDSELIQISDSAATRASFS